MCIVTHGLRNCFRAVAFVPATLVVAISASAAPELTSAPNLAPLSTRQDELFLIRSVLVNNRAVSAASNGTVNLPALPDNVTLTYAPNPQAANIPLRFRCQLDGYEQEWHERTALMRMMIRFIDANQRDVGEQVFEVRGQSPG